MQIKDLINKIKDYIDAENILDYIVDYISDDELKEICDNIIDEYNIDISESSFYEEEYEE